MKTIQSTDVKTWPADRTMTFSFRKNRKSICTAGSVDEFLLISQIQTSKQRMHQLHPKQPVEKHVVYL